MTPAPGTAHQRLVKRLGVLLDQFVSQRRLGEVFFALVDVVLSPQDVVQPDLMFLSNARLDRVTEENIRGAPDLVVEVISEGSRLIDRKLKRALYARHGVEEYWIVDPELRTLEVYRRYPEGRLVKVAELEEEAVLSSPLLPGLAIQLKDLWP